MDSEDLPARTETTTPSPVGSSSSIARFGWAIREALAAALWIFILAKLFVYDIDIFLFQRFAPQLLPLLTFKFFAIIGSIALLWLVLGKDRFRFFVAYVLGYPFVILFWKIPKWFFRNWAVTIAFSPALYSFVTTFRSRFIAGTVAILAALAVSIARDSILLMGAMVILAIYLCAHYVQRFRIAFQPSSIFADIARVVRDTWDHFRQTAVAKDIRAARELDPNSEEYKEKYRQNLSNMFFQTLFLQFLAGKLREVAASRKMDLYFIVALVYTFLLTALVFAFEYWALEKIQPGSFQLPGSPTFWSFLAFSLGTLLPSDFSGVFPSAILATILAYLELFAGFGILIIFVSVVFAIFRERYREDIDKVTDELDRSAAAINTLIQQEYSLSPAEAEATLVEGNPDFVKTISFLRGRGVSEPNRDSNG